MAKKQNKKKTVPELVKHLSGIFVGKITPSLAKEIGIPSASVYLTKNCIKHVNHRHPTEFAQLGITVEDYVKMILSQFNEVRVGTGDSFLLVLRHDEEPHDMAAISLFYDKPHDWWEIKTAEPRSSADLEKRKMLWKKSQPSK